MKYERAFLEENAEGTAEDIVNEFDGVLTSGQGARDYSSEAFYGGWKGTAIQAIVQYLSHEEKKEVWKALNSGENGPIVIGTGEGDGTYPQYELEFLAETLGIKIEITPASWKEIA